LELVKLEEARLKLIRKPIIVNEDRPDEKKLVKITKIYEFEGLNRVEVEESSVGSIIAVTGVEGYPYRRYYLPSWTSWTNCLFVKISEPTISMNFIVKW